MTLAMGSQVEELIAEFSLRLLENAETKEVLIESFAERMLIQKMPFGIRKNSGKCLKN